MKKPTNTRALEFLSTLSLRRATTFKIVWSRLYFISIHALLAESDDNVHSLQYDIEISIHALLAESDFLLLLILAGVNLFLSTLSLRRATI